MSVRQIVLDTETTGLEVSKGNRIVEIGCIELLERRPTGRVFHRYLDPERDMEPGAMEVTGLTREFLAGKPRFEAVAGEFLEFVEGAELIIHNAAFDMAFLEHELSLLGGSHGRLSDRVTVTDSLAMARERFPGQRNSLDALCRRFGVDNAHRELHGALLDAQLLAEVYLALTAGQGDLELQVQPQGPARRGRVPGVAAAPLAVALPAVRVAADEAAAHRARIAAIARAAGGTAVWPLPVGDEAERSVA
jgi:DNA polymerase-3 subunit epsilon